MFSVANEGNDNNYKNVIKIIRNIIIFGVVILILILIVRGILGNKKYDDKKIDTSRDFVYTLKEEKSNTGNKDVVPYINVKGKKAKKINETIQNFYFNYKENDSKYFKYEYSRSNNILSILIKSSSKMYDEDCYSYGYSSYNVDLNTLKILNNEDILDLYKISYGKLGLFLNYKLLDIYDDMVNKKYYNRSLCDYYCFLEQVGIYDVNKNSVLYINDKSLYLYRTFDVCINSKITKYFNENSFKFLVKKK